MYVVKKIEAQKIPLFYQPLFGNNEDCKVLSI